MGLISGSEDFYGKRSIKNENSETADLTGIEKPNSWCITDDAVRGRVIAELVTCLKKYETPALVPVDELAVLPIHSVKFILHGRCNLHCRNCRTHDHNEKLPPEFVGDRIKELSTIPRSLVRTTVSFDGGEPTIYDGLVSLVNEAKVHGFQVHIPTNGLTEPAVIRSLVAVGGLYLSVSFNPEGGDNFKGLDPSSVQRVLKTIGQYAQTNLVAASIVVTRNNIENLPAIIFNLLNSGVADILLTYLKGGLGRDQTLAPTGGQIERFEKEIIPRILEILGPEPSRSRVLRSLLEPENLLHKLKLHGRKDPRAPAHCFFPLDTVVYNPVGEAPTCFLIFRDQNRTGYQGQESYQKKRFLSFADLRKSPEFREMVLKSILEGTGFPYRTCQDSCSLLFEDHNRLVQTNLEKRTTSLIKNDQKSFLCI